ncbi:unnamed protein product [Bursaphelenchus xylophilus]|uniref:(pine wood nematode) hypothetical protein n=1 Tax=Bursaphelenchus xylophilus TaxID=6326 RepID=A0A1I7S3G2_BURXY|nr:unnamed protein product [Bursaphelenchus xylophilus]CAG9116287.1 unnamed protein product [Bursaphelenchus xylophilus]
METCSREDSADKKDAKRNNEAPTKQALRAFDVLLNNKKKERGDYAMESKGKEEGEDRAKKRSDAVPTEADIS